MKTVQPVWKFAAQIGDENPVSYGGLWILTDATGVYAPEAEKLFAPYEDTGGEWTVYRFILERCTLTDGILSDNPFHPRHPAWFAAELDAVAASIDAEESELAGWLCSADPIVRARGYEAIGEYHGWENLDSYPLTFHKRGEVTRRYRAARYNPPRVRPS